MEVKAVVMVGVVLGAESELNSAKSKYPFFSILKSKHASQGIQMPISLYTIHVYFFKIIAMSV